jgi:hypothetical protein
VLVEDDGDPPECVVCPVVGGRRQKYPAEQRKAHGNWVRQTRFCIISLLPAFPSSLLPSVPPFPPSLTPSPPLLPHQRWDARHSRAVPKHAVAASRVTCSCRIARMHREREREVSAHHAATLRKLDVHQRRDKTRSLLPPAPPCLPSDPPRPPPPLPPPHLNPCVFRDDGVYAA